MAIVGGIMTQNSLLKIKEEFEIETFFKAVISLDGMTLAILQQRGSKEKTIGTIFCQHRRENHYYGIISQIDEPELFKYKGRVNASYNRKIFCRVDKMEDYFALVFHKSCDTALMTSEIIEFFLANFR